MNASPKSGTPPLAALLALTALLTLNGCGMMPTRSQPTQPPQIACEERAPTEEAYPLPSGSKDWQAWRKAALAWVGIATAETEKRATTADCLEGLRAKKVIR